MRRKNLLRTLLGGLVLILVAVVALFVVAFKGNAVPERYELFVGSHAFYEELTDSLMPRIRHRAAFRCYARRLDLAGGFQPGASSRDTTCSSRA